MMKLFGAVMAVRAASKNAVSGKSGPHGILVGDQWISVWNRDVPAFKKELAEGHGVTVRASVRKASKGADGTEYPARLDVVFQNTSAEAGAEALELLGIEEAVAESPDAAG